VNPFLPFPLQSEGRGNPEDAVIDAIDALVDEQLCGGPLDDYNVDRYPKCVDCGHDWHGEKCMFCRCQRSTGEELVTEWCSAQEIRAYRRRHIIGDDLREWAVGISESIEPQRRDIEWSVNIGESQPIPAEDFQRRIAGYTLSDIEELRGGFRQPLPWVRIRLWNRDGDCLWMLEGTTRVVEQNWQRNQARILMELHPWSGCAFSSSYGHAPVMRDEMVALEAAAEDGLDIEDGFTLVGYIDPDGLEIETRSEAELSFGQVMSMQESCRVTFWADEEMLGR
jgi:hypothetical protein